MKTRFAVEKVCRDGGARRGLCVAAVAALTVAAMAAAASGQVQRIDMGRGMDANPQVGAGGSNRPIQGYVPLNGNEIISGNVAGLKAFHGQVNTVSPNVFRAPLGTSTLNDFTRTSAGGDASNSAFGQSYYLPSSITASGQGSFYAAPAGGGFDSQLVPRSALNPATPISRVGAGAMGSGFALERSPAAPAPTPGAPGAVLSSPLFTLRTMDLTSGQEATAGQNGPGILRTEGTLQNAGTPQEGQRPLNQGAAGQESGSPQNGALGGQRNNANQPGGTPQEGESSVPGQRDTRVGTQAEDRTARFTQPQDTRVSSTFTDLMTELRKSEAEARARAEGRTGEGEPGQPGTPGTPRGREARGREGTGGSNMLVDNDRDPLTGLPRQGGRGRGATTRPGRLGDSLSARGLESLPTSTLSAGGRVRELPSLVPSKQNGATTTFGMLMARAESQLKESKFLDAATTYEQALLAEPENALALVGKAHAELGAGAYQSAAFDLKFVFTRNPLLVGTRYNMGTFINSQRQEFLIRDLTALVQSNREMNNTGSFLLCYLYYQTGRMQQLGAQLNRWGDVAGHDNWQGVLKRAWLTEGPATRPAEKATGG
jgi:hypothetical protein